MTEILTWADGSADSEAYYSERHGQWVFTDWLNHGLDIVESWVELSLDPEGDQENGLAQVCFACDLEGRCGHYVVEPDDLEHLTGIYVDLIEVRRVGLPNGQILAGKLAADWAVEYVLSEIE